MGASKNQEANPLLRRPQAAGDMRRINARTRMLGGIFDRRRIDCFLTEGSVAFLGWQGSGSRTWHVAFSLPDGKAPVCDLLRGLKPGHVRHAHSSWSPKHAPKIDYPIRMLRLTWSVTTMPPR